MPKTIPLFPGLLYVINEREAWSKTFQRLCKRGNYDPDLAKVMPSHSGQTSSVLLDGVLHVVTGVFNRSPSTACHEAVHCAQEVAKQCAIDPLSECEAFAYLTEHFYEELLK